MIRIAIICFLVSIVRSQFCKLTSDDLNGLTQLFNDVHKSVEEATRGQSGNAAIFLGDVGSEKEALINYLIGNELIAYRPNKYEALKLRKANNSTTGPEIYTGTVSKTKIPTKWKSTRTELQNLEIWDTPPLMDNRGPLQDLNNSIYLYHLIRSLESLKFVVVINCHDIISDDIGQILRLLRTLETLFNDKFRDFLPSISVIISRAPEKIEDILVDREFIKKKLDSNIIQDSTLVMSNVSRDFLRQIMSNKKSVGIFRKPENVEKVTAVIDDNIIQAINNAESKDKSSNQNISLPISIELHPCLEDINYLLSKKEAKEESA
ncbi:uncharacterized protein LOC122505221 [Leptopilina heterotoma]|uniref:Lymph gland apoptosis-related protein n=1 Tax=Leptopilina heterotoma TaxID=63436 RepID=A0A7S7YKW5_9HYME|nr:uncharacterized protein LOC122505221 [Leptopilina heterotoma]QPB69264.1 lymph gland apoptosis-related protein [Leptopilina heterotoma]